MTSAEVQSTGVANLDPLETAALNLWLTRYTRRIVPQIDVLAAERAGREFNYWLVSANSGVRVRAKYVGPT